MKDYAVIRNALVATGLVIIFMIALQPQKISQSILKISQSATDVALAKEPSNSNQTDRKTFSVSSIGFSLPKENYEIVTDEDITTIKTNDTTYTIAIEDVKGSISDKAMSLKNTYKKQNGDANLAVRPVLRNSNLYYEVYADGSLVLAITSIEDLKSAVISAQNTDVTDSDELEAVLSHLQIL